MKETNRDNDRAPVGEAELDKRRNRHNDAATRQCLTLDKDIFGFLGLSKEQCEYVGKTLGAIHLSDFGLSAEMQKDRQ
jgi:hypothetical protein